MKIIFFDFDGVIVDSFDFCYVIRNSISHVSKEEYKKMFEGNINDVASISPVKKTDSFADFFAEYTPELMKCQPYPGIAEAIEKLSKDNMLFIVSSTTTGPIISFLKQYGLEHFFKEVLGNDVEKSKVKKISMVLDRYKTNPAQAIFITDTLGDIKEASECLVKSIAVTWGYHDKATLEKGNPHKIVDLIGELVPAAREYFQATK